MADGSIPPISRTDASTYHLQDPGQASVLSVIQHPHPQNGHNCRPYLQGLSGGLHRTTHARSLAWAAWEAPCSVTLATIILGAVLCCLGWASEALPTPGSPSISTGNLGFSPGLCLQMAVAGLVQSHLFRRNLISPQAESLLPPPALSLALISGKMSSRSFPPGPEIQGEEFH